MIFIKKNSALQGLNLKARDNNDAMDPSTNIQLVIIAIIISSVLIILHRYNFFIAEHYQK